MKEKITLGVFEKSGKIKSLLSGEERLLVDLEEKLVLEVKNGEEQMSFVPLDEEFTLNEKNIKKK